MGINQHWQLPAVTGSEVLRTVRPRALTASSLNHLVNFLKGVCGGELRAGQGGATATAVANEVCHLYQAVVLLTKKKHKKHRHSDLTDALLINVHDGNHSCVTRFCSMIVFLDSFVSVLYKWILIYYVQYTEENKTSVLPPSSQTCNKKPWNHFSFLFWMKIFFSFSLITRHLALVLFVCLKSLKVLFSS